MANQPEERRAGDDDSPDFQPQRLTEYVFRYRILQRTAVDPTTMRLRMFRGSPEVAWNDAAWIAAQRCEDAGAMLISLERVDFDHASYAAER